MVSVETLCEMKAVHDGVSLVNSRFEWQVTFDPRDHVIAYKRLRFKQTS